MDFTLPLLLTSLVDRGNGLLWGSVLIYLLIGAGFFYSDDARHSAALFRPYV